MKLLLLLPLMAMPFCHLHQHHLPGAFDTALMKQEDDKWEIWNTDAASQKN